MNFFQDFTFHWWEFGLLKIAMLALGVLIGSSWAGSFKNKKMTILLWFVFVLPAVYLMIATVRQAN